MPELTDVQLHRAARIEDRMNDSIRVKLTERGWRPRIIGYSGYGAPGWARVMGRVLIARPGADPSRAHLHRGWRSFVTIPVQQTRVLVEVGGTSTVVLTDRGGYVDVRVECDLEPGWRSAILTLLDDPNAESGPDEEPATEAGTEADTEAEDQDAESDDWVEADDDVDSEFSHPAGEPVEAPVLVVDPSTRIGVVSDVDDTVMVTLLPRALLAAWNTFVLNENARRPVSGMAVLYERLSLKYPGAPFIYLSTGAWNVAPTLTRFLSRNLYPRGPLLLTDWGPTQNGWFRSGELHKRRSLQRLAEEFPGVRWLLIGDDGQHDPDIYADFARSHPDHVAAVAIRELSPPEQVLASGLPVPMDQARGVPGLPWVTAPDGASLWLRLTDLGL